MDNTPILDDEWPSDLDPATVPFKGRSVTVLLRQGLFDDWSGFGVLTAADVLSWWNAGPVTVDDVRVTGNEAIRRHHDEADQLRDLEVGLEAVSEEPWARHVWYHDPRYTEFIPRGDATIYDIATSGSAINRRYLWEHLDALRTAMDAQAALALHEAISQYVEVISGQQGDRLEVLLARTGLNGRDPITGAEAGRRLGVSCQRIYQIEQQLHQNRDRACPPAGIWMRQVEVAQGNGWPDGYTDAGIAATCRFFTSTDRPDIGGSDSTNCWPCEARRGAEEFTA